MKCSCFCLHSGPKTCNISWTAVWRWNTQNTAFHSVSGKHTHTLDVLVFSSVISEAGGHVTINGHTTVQQHRRKILLLRGEKIMILEGEAKRQSAKNQQRACSCIVTMVTTFSFLSGLCLVQSFWWLRFLYSAEATLNQHGQSTLSSFSDGSNQTQINPDHPLADSSFIQ